MLYDRDSFVQSVLAYVIILGMYPTEIVTREKPFPAGGASGQPPIEGRRTSTNSPELFPHLSLETCRLLEGIGATAITLTEQLSVYLTPPEQNIPYTPPSAKTLVDVAELLVRTPEMNQLDQQLDPARKRNTPLLVSIVTEKVVMYPPDGKTNSRINRLEMRLKTQAAKNSSDIQVIMQPNTVRTTFAPNGQQLRRLDGVDLNSVKQILSSQGKSPEEVAQIAESHKVIYPTFTITNSRAQLQITFYAGMTDCKLSIQGKNYDSGELTNECPQQSDNQNDTASIKDEYTITMQTWVPLTAFGYRKAYGSSSQDDVDCWLNSLVSEMANKVMKKRKKRMKN